MENKSNVYMWIRHKFKYMQYKSDKIEDLSFLQCAKFCLYLQLTLIGLPSKMVIKLINK